MRTFVGGIRWIAHGVALAATAILCIVLVPVVVLSVGAVAAQQLLTPAPWKDALAAEGVYERLPAVVAVQMAHQLRLTRERLAASGEAPGPEGAPPSFRDLDAAQLGAIFREILPPDWLRAQTERALDAVLADPPPSGPILISLVDLKAHLASGAATRAYLELVKAQPPCAAQDLAAWTAKVSLPSCRPADDVLAQATPAIAAALAGVARGLPDQADLAGAFAADADRGEAAPSPSPSPAPAENGLQRARGALRIVMLAPLLPIALIALLSVRSRRAFLGWIGTPLLFGGLLALALGLETVALVDGTMARLRAGIPGAFAAQTVDVLVGVAHGIAGRLAGSVTLTAGAVAAAGAAMLLIAPLASRRGAPRAGALPARAPAEG